MVHIFLAGAEAFPKQIADSNSYALANYFYLKSKNNAKLWKSDNNLKILFLDSGAFTAWTKGAHIPIEEYCKFVKEADCDYYSVLDVIGDAEGTLQNQKKMEELGTNPVPCFHYGDDFKYLDYYYDKYDFISLGGMVGKSTKLLKLWLDKIFLKYPNRKYHGFGLTRRKLIEIYPWYSVDSSSWIQFRVTKTIYSSEFNESLYMGKNDSVWQNIIKNKANKKWVDKIKSFNINIETMFINYLDILLFNAYGFSEMENLKIKNSILNQKTLF